MRKTAYLLIAMAITVGCGGQPAYNDPIPDHDNFTIESNLVEEIREINVWTPPIYKEGNVSLPVLYMADGGIKEDFPHIANTLSKLIENKSIPPIILVGIENTKRGRDLTGFSEVKGDAEYCPLTDGAKNFRAFITDELFSEIIKRYKVTDEKGLIGESLSGLFVMETFFLTPEAFDFYVAMDPSLWWNNHYLERNANKLLADFPNKKTRLWLAGSSAPDISIHTRTLAEKLKTNAPNQLTWKYSNEPNEKHNTIFRATKEKALTWILNAK